VVDFGRHKLSQPDPASGSFPRIAPGLVPLVIHALVLGFSRIKGISVHSLSPLELRYVFRHAHRKLRRKSPRKAVDESGHQLGVVADETDVVDFSGSVPSPILSQHILVSVNRQRFNHVGISGRPKGRVLTPIPSPPFRSPKPEIVSVGGPLVRPDETQEVRRERPGVLVSVQRPRGAFLELDTNLGEFPVALAQYFLEHRIPYGQNFDRVRIRFIDVGDLAACPDAAQGQVTYTALAVIQRLPPLQAGGACPTS